MKNEEIRFGLSGEKGYILEVSNPVSIKPSEAFQNALCLEDLSDMTICEFRSKRPNLVRQRVNKSGEPMKETRAGGALAGR